MPLQDLNPQLRTRLSRVERMVGWFVILATLILLAGFACYIYATAHSRGWFVTKLNYATGLNDATGFKAGDAVKLMGRDVGAVTLVELNAPDKQRGVTIFFNIREPYYGYIWYDSHVRVVSDFLGNRYLEVEKGRNGVASAFKDRNGELLVLNSYQAWQQYKRLTNELATNIANTNLSGAAILTEATNQLMKLIRANTNLYYTNAFLAKYNRAVDPSLPLEAKNYYWIPADDTPALGDRLNAVANTVEAALPNILNLTNQLAAVLSNANNAVSRLDSAVAKTDPILTNLAIVTGNLRDPNGSLGNWLIPTNLAAQLHETLQSASTALQAAHTTLDDTDTNVTMLALDLDKTLQHLSDLTSNLNSQVQMNTNLISEISATIVHTDGLVQGLKRHWLLRSAFKTKKPAKPAKKADPSPALPPHQ
jgi:ABC-type transporter Mla subunit MlaD